MYFVIVGFGCVSLCVCVCVFVFLSFVDGGWVLYMCGLLLCFLWNGFLLRSLCVLLFWFFWYLCFEELCFFGWRVCGGFVFCGLCCGMSVMCFFVGLCIRLDVLVFFCDVVGFVVCFVSVVIVCCEDCYFVVVCVVGLGLVICLCCGFKLV